MFNFMKGAGFLISGLLLIQIFAQTVYAQSETFISKEQAEKIALHYVKDQNFYGSVKAIDISYDFVEKTPIFYIFIIAKDNIYNDMSINEIIAQKVTKGVMTVYVSTTQDNPTIPVSNIGLPKHILKEERILETAGDYFHVDTHNLILGKLFTLKGKGLIREVTNNTVVDRGRSFRAFLTGK